MTRSRGLTGLAGFLAIGAWSLLQIHRRSALALVAVALLWGQVLFVTEIWGVRLSEVFVLYRSYLWCALIPLALVLVADMMIRRLSGGMATTGAFVFCAAVALAVGLNYRLQVFSDEVAVWQEAVDRNQGVSWPGAGRAPYQLGTVLGERGEYDRALSAFGEAVRLVPEHSRAHNNIGNIYYLRNDQSSAVNAWLRAMRADPGNPMPHYNMAMIAARQGDATRANAYFREYVRLAKTEGPR